MLWVGNVPEGDTIATSAATLAGVLVGRVVTRFSSPVPGVEARARSLGVVGSEVTAVEARGKHLLIRFASGLTIHSHLRMSGRWEVGAPGRPTNRPSRRRSGRSWTTPCGRGGSRGRPAT